MKTLVFIINLIVSVWLIPKYIGKDRQIGYQKSAILCLLLTPIIGGIITITSPKKRSINQKRDNDNI